MQPLYLGIEFGTSGCRACVINKSKTIIAEYALPLPAPWRDGDEVFQDPATWWDALEQLLKKLNTNQRAALTALTINAESGNSS